MICFWLQEMCLDITYFILTIWLAGKGKMKEKKSFVFNACTSSAFTSVIQIRIRKIESE